MFICYPKSDEKLWYINLYNSGKCFRKWPPRFSKCQDWSCWYALGAETFPAHDKRLCEYMEFFQEWLIYQATFHLIIASMTYTIQEAGYFCIWLK